MRILIAFALLLAGCATPADYYRAVEATHAKNVELARASAEAESVRYQALMRIAESGDSAAKVAAAMALAMGGQRGAPALQLPQQANNEALQWASILVPGVTQGMSIYYSAKTTMNASNNATALGMNTNATFAQFASEINDPTIVHAPQPLVVTQPPPLIVEQPAPIIVEPFVVEPYVVTP